MPVEENGEVYVTLSEGAQYLNVTRDTFRNNVVPHVQSYEVGPFKRKYYKRSDLNRFKGVRPIEDK